MNYSGRELLDPTRILDRVGVQSGWHVADLGCGSLGHFVFPLARMVGGDGLVHAVDIQKTAVQSVKHGARREQLWNVRSIWSDVERHQATPITPESLHLVLMTNLLHQVQNKMSAWQEALRLLQPDGLLLIIEWKAEQTVLGPKIEDRLIRETILADGERYGLVLRDLFEAGDHHEAFLFQKPERAEETRVLSVSPPVFDSDV